jgi:iron-sulfur cluster repair protein YtfE (RIC family)
MSMQRISEPLISDHHHCDELFLAAEQAVREGDWTACRQRFDIFNNAMQRHFGAEENVLFPAFEAATGMSAGPTAVMRHEHEQMRSLLEDMAAAIGAANGADYLGCSETLLLHMRQHNLKEENVLYPMAERVLAGSDIDFADKLAA